MDQQLNPCRQRYFWTWLFRNNKFCQISNIIKWQVWVMLVAHVQQMEFYHCPPWVNFLWIFSNSSTILITFNSNFWLKINTTITMKIGCFSSLLYQRSQPKLLSKARHKLGPTFKLLKEMDPWKHHELKLVYKWN